MRCAAIGISTIGTHYTDTRTAIKYKSFRSNSIQSIRAPYLWGIVRSTIGIYTSIQH